MCLEQCTIVSTAFDGIGGTSSAHNTVSQLLCQRAVISFQIDEDEGGSCIGWYITSSSSATRHRHCDHELTTIGTRHRLDIHIGHKAVQTKVDLQ